MSLLFFFSDIVNVTGGDAVCTVIVDIVQMHLQAKCLSELLATVGAKDAIVPFGVYRLAMASLFPILILITTTVTTLVFGTF